jgi:hypothetical protein
MSSEPKPTFVEDKGMRLPRSHWSGLVAAMLVGLVGVTMVAATSKQFLAVLGVSEGGGGVKFQQWDGKQWTVLIEWIATDQALVRPLVEVAAKYVQEKGLAPRACA